MKTLQTMTITTAGLSLIMAPAAASYMTTLLVMVLVFETILFPVLSLAFILGAIAGYYLSRRAP